MQIRSVIFDFGGVLCFHPSDEEIAQAAETCGVSVEVFLPAFWANRIPYDGGEDPRVYWRGVTERAGRTFDEALLPKLIGHEIEFWNHYDTRALDWIAQLRSAGIRVGILSNLPRPLGENLRATNFVDHFDHVTFSYELRLVKPDAAIYEDAIRGVGVPPAEALFLDDRPENVEGARAAGLHAELFETWEKFVEEIPARYGLPAPAVERRQ